MSRFFFAVLATVIGNLVLTFFPIFIEANVYYDMNRKKFAFALYAYGFLKLVGGYVTTYKGGIAVHISEKTAFLIPYAKMNSDRKKFSFLKTFRLVSFALTTETGAEYLSQAALAHSVLRTYFFSIGGAKENIANNLWLTDGDELKVSLKVVAYFNLFILFSALFKFIKEKIKILWQKKTKKSIV